MGVQELRDQIGPFACHIVLAVTSEGRAHARCIGRNRHSWTRSLRARLGQLGYTPDWLPGDILEFTVQVGS